MTDTSTDTYAAAIEAMIDAGFDPTDEAPVLWLDRWDAYIDLGDGYIVAHVYEDDEMILLQVLTSSGVIRSEVRFDTGPIGLVMFAAAAHAAATVA